MSMWTRHVTAAANARTPLSPCFSPRRGFERGFNEATRQLLSVEIVVGVATAVITA